jgi:hypothetical protein
MFNIYILQLENNKYYIGKTKNSELRIRRHFNGKGSEFTKLFKPIKVEKIYFNCDDELKYTLKYMYKYGIENVRGGPFVKINLPKEYVTTIKQMLSSEYECCFNCGKKGHFVRECKEDSKSVNSSIISNTKKETYYESIKNTFFNLGKYINFYYAS